MTTHSRLKLNCDLGEGFGPWKMGMDEKLMAYVDQANIACGFHAGDPLVIERAIKFAVIHKVEIGAHPAYPDLQGFGRRSLTMHTSEIVAMLHYQIAALDGMAKSQGSQVSYVKPHGALYNDMMHKTEVMRAVMHGVASYHESIPLMIQATPEWQAHQHQADMHKIELCYEAFADRRYQDDGKLVSRKQPGAVLQQQQAIEQAQHLLEDGQVITLSGNYLPVKADSLCVHGDSEHALESVKAIRQVIDQKQD